MEITGTIYADTGIKVGRTERGSWKVASYVLKTEGNDPHFVAFDVFDGQDGRIDRLGIEKGKRMTIYFDIRAHEYKGRWYNQVRAYDAKEQTKA